jgi:hypothetical protein
MLDEPQNLPPTSPNQFTSNDVASILREREWSAAELSAEQFAWCERAAAFLGPHSADREALADLLSLIFNYDAHQILQQVESHSVLARYGAREIIRRVAFLLLEGPPLNSERLKEIVNEIKATSDLRSRDLFHPLRLALAGRAGEGQLDRVVLLLDEAAPLQFAAPVKSARTRILEFCAALD